MSLRSYFSFEKSQSNKLLFRLQGERVDRKENCLQRGPCTGSPTGTFTSVDTSGSRKEKGKGATQTEHYATI